MKKNIQFIIKKNDNFIYAERNERFDKVTYHVFNGNSLVYYSEECFNDAFYPFTAVRLSTFINNYAYEWLIGYINDDEMAKKLFDRIQDDNISTVDLLNMIRFYENNIKPSISYDNYEKEYNLVKEIKGEEQEDKKEEFSFKSVNELIDRRDRKRVYTNI